LNEDVNFPQWCRAKGYDTFGCLGPVIVPDLDWAQARVITKLDGVERQNYALSDMIFFARSAGEPDFRDMSLLPGDVIACGTIFGRRIDQGWVDGRDNNRRIGSLVNALAVSPGALTPESAAPSPHE